MRNLHNIRIIAVDHGYGNVKTANTITPTGIKAYPTKPIFGGDILEYAGTYYLIGEGHKEFIADKSMDEDYYILTLMAVARELSLAGLTRADVHLVVGLPMTWVRTQRESFRVYLMRKTDVHFRFAGKEHGLNVVDEYIDDGWSGTNFDRPAFQRMIDDSEDGKINCVITKDLSRLGRNYVMTGQYTDFYFPSKGVRYIAINDNVDTLNGESELAPFLNILNEMHARQTSKKVKAALHTKFTNGLHGGAYAPLGYMRDPEQNGHLIIDPDTRWIVEKIFDLAVHGSGASKITRILLNEKVPSPGWFNYHRYGTFAHIYAGQPEDKAYVWTIAQVKKLLKDEVYIGHSIHNRQSNISFKNKKKVRKPVDEWFKVENTHEAIISEEDFRRVQEMIDTRRRSQKNGELQLFAGLIKCADCGWSLGHGRRKTKNGYDGYYHCSKNGQGLHQCSMHYIRDDVLCAYVLSRLQYWSQQAQQNEEKLLKRLMGATDRERSAAKKKQAAELHKAEKRKAEIDSLFMKMYEDWLTGQRSLPDAAGRLIQVQLDRQKQPLVLLSPYTGEHTKELFLMTTFNFDMHRIGQTIARLRRERNMTQMQLADEMGVSFQAVSNWERGVSHS